MSETKVTVDPAGLTELLRPLTTEFASNPKANSKLYFQPPIPQAAAVSLLANLSDATVAKYQPHGDGLRTPVLFLEATLELTLHATPIPCLFALITLKEQATLNAKTLNKWTLHAQKNVQMMKLTLDLN